MLLFLALAGVSFLLNFKSIDQKLSTYFYQNKRKSYSDYEVKYICYSPYHKIEILEKNNSDRKLFLNGRIQFGKNSHRFYSYYLSEYPATLLKSPSVCVLGCGSMSSVGRIGNFAKDIQIVDIDEKVFETSKIFFSKYNGLDKLKNWMFKADDAKHFMANSGVKYDLILHDIPPANTRQTALTYTREFFKSVRENLLDGGIFSISSLRSKKSNYTKRVLATLIDVFDTYFVLEKKNKIFFYGICSDNLLLSKEKLYEQLNFSKRNDVTILLKSDIEEFVKNNEVITVNNLGDLIFD